MYMHLTELDARNNRDKIIKFAKQHFRDKKNWIIPPNSTERVYNYQTPTLGDFWDADGEKLFVDVSEPGFFFVLKQMRKMGTVKFFDPVARDRDTDRVKVFAADHYLNAFEIPGVSKTVDEDGTHYKYAGNIHQESAFTKSLTGAPEGVR